MTTVFTQGVCSDGAAILKDGVAMTIEEILAELRNRPVLIGIDWCKEVMKAPNALEYLNGMVKRGNGKTW